MDVSIARIHISVHFAEREQQDQQPQQSRAERVVNRTRQLARVEQQREELHTWMALHGWR